MHDERCLPAVEPVVTSVRAIQARKHATLPLVTQVISTGISATQFITKLQTN